MRILSFSDFRCNADPLYKFLNVLKLDDLIALLNCLFVHDFINNKLPSCFKSYFQSIKEIHPINTKSSVIGCIHVPYFQPQNMDSIQFHVNVLIVEFLYTKF